MEENDRKNFLEELIGNVKKALEIEKRIDEQLQDIKTKEA